MDPAAYALRSTDDLESPQLLIFRDLLERNLDEMLRLAGSPQRLRPHCKTHKNREIVRLWLDRGVTRHKAATLAECALLLTTGVRDVLWAYQPVGPNVPRLIDLLDSWPEAHLAVTLDDRRAVEGLATALARTPHTVGVLLDLDSGMKRTGIAVGPAALDLAEAVAAAPHLKLEGLHWYDGHLRSSDREDRRQACLAGWNQLTRFRDQLLLQGLPVESIVAGGTGTFPILAELDEPGLQLSPGTTVYHDAGYAAQYPELPFQPALGILTRVISCQRPGFVTLDLGHKACAADPPAGQRLFFPAYPQAREVQQSEEHLVLAVDEGPPLALGDPLVAIPTHACPTSAAYDEGAVVSGGQVVARWSIAARGRRLRG